MDKSLNISDQKRIYQHMAKAIREIDLAFWVIFGEDSETAQTLRESRLPLINYILENGYVLQEYTYRVIKAK